MHPQQIEQFDSAKYRKNQLSRIKSTNSNISSHNGEEKVFDKEIVTGQSKNYKLFTLRESSVLDFNKVFVMNEDA